MMKGIKQMLMGIALIGVGILTVHFLDVYCLLFGAAGLVLTFVGFYFTDD